MFEENHLEQCALEVLKDIGVKKGDIILDCCCGYGHYTLPASRLVGKEGLVYAVDTDLSKLLDLKKRITSGLFKNIRIMHEDVEQKISLENDSVDIILLYDIFWYFRPNEENLTHLLHEVYRISRTHALVSVFPKHIDFDQLQCFAREMDKQGFCLIGQLQRQVVHEKSIEVGKILNFQANKRSK